MRSPQMQNVAGGVNPSDDRMQGGAAPVGFGGGAALEVREKDERW